VQERCYDCGQLIPEGRVCRRTVAVAWTSSSGYVDWGKPSGQFARPSGTVSQSSTTYSKVSLCLPCSVERDKQAERLRMLVACVVLVLLIGWGLCVLGAAAWNAAPRVWECVVESAVARPADRVEPAPPARPAPPPRVAPRPPPPRPARRPPDQEPLGPPN
jgi:hypothetical protein